MRFLLFLLPFFLATAFPVDATELIRADRSETTLQDSGVLRIEVGGVSYQHPERRLSVSADSARLWIPAGAVSIARFFGRVAYQDSARQLDAATMTYLPRTDVSTFVGAVRVMEEDRLMTARRVAYRKKENRLDAEGGVTLNYGEQRISLSAPAMTYHVLADSGTGTGGVRVVRLPDKTGDSLAVRSDSMHFACHGDRLRFVGRVRMDYAGMLARAPRGRYFRQSDRLELRGGTYAGWIQNRETRADSVTSSAERMHVRGAGGNALKEIVLVGAARLRMEAVQPGRARAQSVHADSVVLGMAGGRIVTVDASGEAETMLTARDSAIVDLKGQRIRMDFRDGVLDSLTVHGRGAGAYISSDSATVSRISGGSIAFGFERGAVRFVGIRETARCTHRSKTGNTGDIQLTGDHVKLTFDGDTLANVQAEGGVRGRYRPVESGEAP